MTPKEKAEHLVSQYEICTRPLFALGDYENEKHYNKQCALIAVNEILDTLNEMDDTLSYNAAIFYNEVKTHIQQP